MRILLVADAPTSEAEGSVASLEDVRQVLTLSGADLRVVSIRSGEDLLMEEIGAVDLVFLTTHGLCGEDGSLSFLLRTLGTPCTGPPPAVHAMCLNKVAFKLFARALGVPVPTTLTANVTDYGPRVVKPVSGGGSQGVYYESGTPTTERAVDVPLLIERFVRGTFVTCAVFPWLYHRLPLLQVDHDDRILSYFAKRNPSHRKEICPAWISCEAECQIRLSAQLLYETLEATGPLRFDYVVDPDGSAWLLEANSIPGLTRQGNLARIVVAAGFTYEDLVAAVVLETLDGS